MKLINTREDFLKSYPKKLKMAEIGVFKGDFSKKIFEICEPSELFLIDIFDGIMGSGDKNGQNMEYINLGEHYRLLKEHFSNNSEVKLMKGLSSDSMKSIPDNYLDFIYIDADHEYDSEKKDLEISFEKVLSNGYISGHDYEINRFPGVVKAVSEFCLKYNQEIEALTQDGLPSYFIKIKK